MFRISIPEDVNFASYAPYISDPRVYYGLPKDVTFCVRCGYSNQKPNSEKEYRHTIETPKPTVLFDKAGVCSACLVSEKKKEIDWQEREKMLAELCSRYRKNDGSYDCLVPGSGGKDSFYAAYKLKYTYGMNPLTVTWAPHIYTDWGWRNFQSWIHAGFDNYLFTPNGRAHRLLTRLALEKLFHPFQPFMMGQMYYPPRMAEKLNIPLVFYGENPVEYGNRQEVDFGGAKESSFFSAKDVGDLYISGYSLRELRDSFGLAAVDLEPYLPIEAGRLEKAKINVQYLGHYLPWHPQECYYYAVENGGFEAAPERSAGTYSKYSSIDDKIDDLHYYTTYIKFGIGRATYDSSQEVRNGEIERDEAISLIRKYDGEYPTRFEKECFSYLSLNKREFPEASIQFEQPVVDRAYFQALTNKFRSPHLWMYDEAGWRLRKTIWE